MKKIICFLLVVFIMTNVIWGWMYFKNLDKPKNTVVRVYDFSGGGEKWDIADYKIIITPTKILRGHGKLAYKGDYKNIENSTYYKFEMKEKNIYGNYETVYVSEAISKNGPVAILENLEDIGSITSEYSNFEVNKGRQNYESTTITITWNDNEGELHSETINLSINNEITID